MEIEIGIVHSGDVTLKQYFIHENGEARFEVELPDGLRLTGDSLERAMSKAYWCVDWLNLRWVKGYEIRLYAEDDGSLDKVARGFKLEISSVQGWICYQKGADIPLRFAPGKRPTRNKKTGEISNHGYEVQRQGALYVPEDENTTLLHERLGILAGLLTNYIHNRILNKNYKDVAMDWLPKYVKALIDETPMG